MYVVRKDNRRLKNLDLRRLVVFYKKIKEHQKKSTYGIKTM